MHDQYYIWGCYLYWYNQYDTSIYFCKSVDGMSVQHFLQHFLLNPDKISPLISTLHKRFKMQKRQKSTKNPRNKPFLTYFWDYFHWLFFVQTDQFKRRGWDSNPFPMRKFLVIINNFSTLQHFLQHFDFYAFHVHVQMTNCTILYHHLIRKARTKETG